MKPMPVALTNINVKAPYLTWPHRSFVTILHMPVDLKSYACHSYGRHETWL